VPVARNRNASSIPINEQLCNSLGVGDAEISGFEDRTQRTPSSNRILAGKLGVGREQATIIL
jgi:hypothetical protein